MSGGEKICPKCGATYAANLVFCPEDGTPLHSANGDPLVGQVVADRYRIISRIGEGGMGQVYLAEQVHMRRRCAVKFLNTELAGDPKALKRFMREAENAGRIDHPNVVTMYDFGQAEGGRVYLAMEFVEGETLRKRVEREGSLRRDMVASVVRQTAAALGAAHQLQIVHRDLKPDNIMLVVTPDGDMRVKVVDFGIAKARGIEQKVTITGVIVGTPDYMSPEQVTGDEVDGRSDQYSLALVAVKMLTGHLPFAIATGIESLTSRLTTEPLPLRELRTDVAWPQQLEEVITRALAPDPNKRFATIAEFARQFDRAMARVEGAVAATVPDLRVEEIIPATRHDMHRNDRGEPIPATRIEAPAKRSMGIGVAWLGAAVLVIGGGALVWSARRATELPSTPLSQPLAADTIAASGVPHDSAALRQQETHATTAPPSMTVEQSPKPAASQSTPAVKPVASDAPRPEAPAPVAVAPEATKNAAPVASVLSSEGVRDELARVRAQAGPNAAAAALDSAAASLDALLPRARTGADSIRVLYARAQTAALRDDTPTACKTLSRALALAAGTPVENAITRTARDLSCP